MKKRGFELLHSYVLLRRYKRSHRKEKTQLLDELCDLHHYNRKYLLQVFNCLTGKQYVRRGRKRIYDEKELIEPLKYIWLATDQMCPQTIFYFCSYLLKKLTFYLIQFGLII